MSVSHFCDILSDIKRKKHNTESCSHSSNILAVANGERRIEFIIILSFGFYLFLYALHIGTMVTNAVIYFDANNYTQQIMESR